MRHFNRQIFGRASVSGVGYVEAGKLKIALSVSLQIATLCQLLTSSFFRCDDTES